MSAIVELLGGLVPALALLGAILGYMMARGGAHIWGATFGKLAGWLAGVLPGPLSLFGHTVFPDMRAWVLEGNNAVLGYFQLWAQGAEDEIALSIDALRVIFQANAESVDWLARETDATFDWLTTVKLPRAVKAAAAAVLPAALLARLIAEAVRRALPHAATYTRTVVEHERTFVTRLPRTLERELSRDEAVLYKLSRAVAAAGGSIALPLPADLGHLRGEVAGLGRWAWRVNRRLAKLETLVGATAIAAVLGNLWGVSFRCVRSRGPIGRMLRALCFAPAWLINLLIAGVVEAFVLADLCDFSDLLIATTEQLRPGLLELVDVESALIGCHGYTAPNVLALPPVALPQLVGAVTIGSAELGG